MATQRPILRLGPGDSGRSLSAEEFAEAEFEPRWSYEREEGRLVVMPPDSPEHDLSSEPMRDYLGAYRLAHPELVESVISECWVRVAAGTDRIGDIGVFLVANRSGLARPQRVPELIFEVVSPGRAARERDYVKQRGEYYQLGVLEYVVIDRMRRRVTVYADTEGRYRKTILHPGDRYGSRLLPGLEVPLENLL
ncbi:MAG TPA: Uma2 family endonuclease [Isosphaeraceae bacterium]|nr:Uma2 family endonuclease [Isosphaeraceae bacterium]